MKSLEKDENHQKTAFSSEDLKKLSEIREILVKIEKMISFQ